VQLALAVGRHQAHLAVLDPLGIAELNQEPLAVGRPLVVLVAVAVGVVLVRGEDQPGRLRLEVDHLEGDPVLQVRHLLAVGGEGGLELLGRRGHHRLLLEDGGQVEVGLLLPHDGDAVDVPVVVLLRRVDQRPPVGAEVHAPLLPRRVGDALRGPRLQAGDEDLAAEHPGVFLAVRRQRRLRQPFAHRQHLRQRVPAVHGQAHRDLGGLPAGFQRVDLAVVAEAQQVVLGAGEEADGVPGKFGELDGLARIGHGGAVHVERPVQLAEVEEVLVVGGEHRVPVLAGERGELGVSLRLEVVEPDVAGHRRGMVLAPAVLVALDVMVDQAAPGRIRGGVERRHRQRHVDAAPGHRDTVELGHGPGGELDVGGGLLPSGREQHRPVVGGEGAGHFGGRMEGEAPGLAAGGRHHEHVEVAVAV